MSAKGNVAFGHWWSRAQVVDTNETTTYEYDAMYGLTGVPFPNNDDQTDTRDAPGAAAMSSARGTLKWAQRCLLLVPLTVIVVGCGPADVGFTFDNRTDVAFCYSGSPQEAAAGRCLQELEPRAKTDSGADCDNDSSRPIIVIIAVKQGGGQIYNRTASCGEWHDTDRRFVIEQEGDEFIVTDSLPDEGHDAE